MCVGACQSSSCEDESSGAEMVKPTQEPSLLLELAAQDDLPGFKRAVESGGGLLQDVDVISCWYCKQQQQETAADGSSKRHRMALEERTPAAVAALYGSRAVLDYILRCYTSKGGGGGDINRRCGSDSATALHCAASGGSKNAAEVTRLLLGFGADPGVLDALGRRPADVIVAVGHLKAELEQLLSDPDYAASSSSFSSSSLSLSSCSSSSSSSSLPSSPTRMAKEKPRSDYPVDPSLPDIRSGIYGTDEFRMFSFKVRPCSRAYSHDWTECPFAHPGENARRRDPRKHSYGCAPCPDFRKGASSCKRGDACEFAHGVFECWLHPAQYRTRLCKDGVACERRVCFFAHVAEELRLVSNSSNYNTSLTGTPFSPSSPSSPSIFAMSPKTPPISPQQGLVCPPQLSVPPLRLPGVVMPQASSRLRATLSARDMPAANNLTMLRNPGLSIVPPTNLDDLFALSEMHAPSPRSPTPLLLNTQFLNQQHASPWYSTKHSTVQLSPCKSQELLLVQPHGFGTPRLSAPSPNLSPLSDWGSPTGKLEWGTAANGRSFRDNFKNKPLSSFAFRTAAPPDDNPEPELSPEPDLSWVQTLVKDNSPVNPDAVTAIPASPVSATTAAVAEPSVVGSWIEQIHFDPQIVA